MRCIRTGALGAVLAFGLVSISGVAEAASVLNYSFTSTGVGYCPAGNCAHVIYTDSTFASGYGVDNASSSADPAWGAANASTGLAAGPVALPSLHSDTSTLVSHSPVGFGRAYSFAQGAVRLRWIGDAVDIAVSDFVGTFNFTQTPGPFAVGGFGEASASLAILTSAVGRNALGDTWFADDGSGGFAADCSTEGAIGVGETGVITQTGAVSRTVVASCPGVPTFHLETGDTFGIWARVFTFRENGGLTDASHSFNVGLSSSLSASQQAFLASNLVQAGVPEPRGWAMMLVGLGAAGTIARARRKPGAAVA